MNNMLSEKIEAKTAEALDMPKDTALNLSKIVLNGREEMFCGGYKGIRLYTEKEIRFAAAGNIITVTGEGLMIKCIEEDEIRISGKIKSVEFI